MGFNESRITGMSTKCEIMKSNYIECGDRRVCVWPVLSMSDGIPQEQQDCIRCAWPRYEKAMRIYQNASMVNGSLTDSAASACSVIDAFLADVARACLGERLSQRKRPQHSRSIADFEILKRVTFHSE